MEEKLLFQFSTDYRAARRSLLVKSVIGGLLVGSPLFAVIAVSLPLGILLPIIVYFVAAFCIVIGWERTSSYIVTDTRVSVKSKDMTRTYALGSISDVKLKRTLSSEDRRVSTVTFRAIDKNGKTKTVAFRYVFNADECYKFLKERAELNIAEKQ